VTREVVIVFVRFGAANNRNYLRFNGTLLKAVAMYEIQSKFGQSRLVI
jgi:hypothetical protein